MEQDSVYKLRLSSQLKAEAHAKARRHGRKLADVIRDLLIKWLAEDEDKPPP